MVSRWLIWALLIVSFLGIIDSGYLTAKHYIGGPVTCSFLEGCDEVVSSKYAEVLGIPLALAGVFFYLSIFLLSALYLDSKNRKLLSFIILLGVSGFLVSLILVYLQIFVIKAICFYCMLSALSSALIFVLSMFVWRFKLKVGNFKINN